MALCLLGCWLAFWGWAMAGACRAYGLSGEIRTGDGFVRALRMAMPYAADRLRLADRLGRRFRELAAAHLVLYGESQVPERLRQWSARALLESSAVSVALLALTAACGFEPGWAPLLSVSGTVVPVVGARRMIERVERRKRELLAELLEFLNRFVLLLNAGEPVQQAFARAATSGGAERGGPLAEELEQVVRQLQNRMSFQVALEHFYKRCALPEVSAFTTTLLLNYRRGGSELALTMREMSRVLWEKRKARVMIAGEQASSKLVFPMMLIFLVVLMIVAAPAVMVMN